MIRMGTDGEIAAKDRKRRNRTPFFSKSLCPLVMPALVGVTSMRDEAGWPPRLLYCPLWLVYRRANGSGFAETGSRQGEMGKNLLGDLVE